MMIKNNWKPKCILVESYEKGTKKDWIRKESINCETYVNTTVARKPFDKKYRKLN